MAHVMTLRQAVRVWILAAIAVGCLALGPRATDALLRIASAPARGLAVVATVLTTLPLILLAAYILRRTDEFSRRIWVSGAALGLAAMLLVYPAFFTMQEAGFVSAAAWLPFLPTGLALWFTGALAARWYYQRAG